MRDDDPLIDYYAARAVEYERVYAKPERQADIAALKAWLPPRFEGRRVLEVACGTGYWSACIAPVARQWVGVDAAPETLALARARLPTERVQLVQGDAYALPAQLGPFDAAFAGFWFSHVPKHRQREFLEGWVRRLEPGARVVLIDNRYVEGSNHAITERDDDGNTYQTRRLDNGSTHRVLKNFPTPDELQALAAEWGEEVRCTEWTYYWALEFVTPTSP